MPGERPPSNTLTLRTKTERKGGTGGRKEDDMRVKEGGDRHPQNISCHSRTFIKGSEGRKGRSETDRNT